MSSGGSTAWIASIARSIAAICSARGTLGITIAPAWISLAPQHRLEVPPVVRDERQALVTQEAEEDVIVGALPVAILNVVGNVAEAVRHLHEPWGEAFVDQELHRVGRVGP
jgi:hypothetical protein